MLTAMVEQAATTEMAAPVSSTLITRTTQLTHAIRFEGRRFS
jgi:hypothetical protein